MVEGTGEPSRAMLSERVTCDSAGETLPDSRDDEGTACGFDDSGCLPAMLTCNGASSAASGGSAIDV